MCWQSIIAIKYMLSHCVLWKGGRVIIFYDSPSEDLVQLCIDAGSGSHLIGNGYPYVIFHKSDLLDLIKKKCPLKLIKYYKKEIIL